MGRLVAICRSEKRGTRKTPVESAVLRENWGLVGDAHAGTWHRQVSLLGLLPIEDFRKKGAKIEYGAFGENLVVDGFDAKNLQVGQEIQVGECLLELTQIGKACHSHCAIYKTMGDCIMPREGVFAKVLKGGTIRPGDKAEVFPLRADHPFTAAVITLSDRAFRGTYEDRSGPLIAGILRERGYDVVEQILLPDGKPMLEDNLCRLADQRQVNFILTTGGTGFSVRDVTPEATVDVCDRMADGISQAILVQSLPITDRAMLSRGRSGIRKRTLIVNLPGSPKACREDLDIILPALPHGLGILRGTETD